MKIVLLGVSGNVGIQLLLELLRRQHRVTGIARIPEKVAPQVGLTLLHGDVKREPALTQLLSRHDAVIHSVRFQSSDPHKVINATKNASVNRLLVVGSAGNLEVAPGRQFLDSPEFPESCRAEAVVGRGFLDVLRGAKTLDWSFLSPSASLSPGARTGKFRLGGDQLLVNQDNESKISLQDFAVALVDELEDPKHSRQQFTVGY